MLYNAAPIRFDSLSMVTATLGDNDPALGTRATDGQREYVFIYNAGGASAMAGYAMVPNSAATNYSLTVTANTSADAVIGVVYHATITTAAYGWLVTRGIVPVEATDGVAARGLIEVGADGYAAPVSNTTGNKAPAFGVALAAIASAASGNAYISC